MDILLRIKNWQLFLISFIVPWLFIIAYLTVTDLDSFETTNNVIGVISFLSYIIFLAWNYCVVKTFNKYENALKPRQIERIDWLLIILIIYVFYMATHEYLGISQFLITRILVWVFTFASIYAILFVVFCTAKTLKYLQLKNQLRTSDIIVEMFVIFYFPIGIWWLQRKVNGYYNEIKAHTVNKL